MKNQEILMRLLKRIESDVAEYGDVTYFLIAEDDEIETYTREFGTIKADVIVVTWRERLALLKSAVEQARL